jgi:hypothetical protein
MVGVPVPVVGIAPRAVRGLWLYLDRGCQCRLHEGYG